MSQLGELIGDQLPSTPSRTVPSAFGSRIIAGVVSGAAIGTSGQATAGAMAGAMVAGLVGAIVGTLGGHAFRARLAAAFHRDRPAAFIEDAIALGGALLIGLALRS